MERYICRTTTELPGYMQANFMVPEGTQMHTGDIYVAETLNEDLGYGNWTVYNPDTISDITKQIPVIILNNGFETLTDGRRPKGQPDYTQYFYNPGEVVTGVRLLPEIKFEISYDVIENKSEIEPNGYLVVENDNGRLQFVSTLAEVNSKVYFVVEALKHFRCGGQFGEDFTNTMVVRVKYLSNKATDPEITAIQADIVQGLQVGNENVASGATVLTMSAIGGTQPYTYELVSNGEASRDNDKFVIGSAEVKVGADPLAEAKTYKIYVQATDSKGKTFKEGFDIPVAGA